MKMDVEKKAYVLMILGCEHTAALYVSVSSVWELYQLSLPYTSTARVIIAARDHPSHTHSRKLHSRKQPAHTAAYKQREEQKRPSNGLF